MSNSAQNPVITITPHDLPLYCSGSRNELWNGHPRVFLPIQSHGTSTCPYCGTVYELNGPIGHH